MGNNSLKNSLLEIISEIRETEEKIEEIERTRRLIAIELNTFGNYTNGSFVNKRDINRNAEDQSTALLNTSEAEQKQTKGLLISEEETKKDKECVKIIRDAQISILALENMLRREGLY